jgi:adenine-specific DNA-methyltransferase
MVLDNLELLRLNLSQNTSVLKKALFGQYMTPISVAKYMASLFPEENGICRLLDAGAGIGSLSAAFLERWRLGEFRFDCVDVDAFELDSSLHKQLYQTLQSFANDQLTVNVYCDDFIHTATSRLYGDLFSVSVPFYTHAILNPPYKKINSNSLYRTVLRRVGIETVNLYAAFVALSIALVVPNGHIVAIIPRSFCNGPYYRSFRNFILAHTAVRHIHLFKSRTQTFKEDNVLQENVIIHLERSGVQEEIIVSTSTDDTFTDTSSNKYSFDRIVLPNDTERFIHIPHSLECNSIEFSKSIQYTLNDLGITVSTGPVVDFRVKQYLHEMPCPNTVPLLYSSHFINMRTIWPIYGTKRANSIERNADTQKWLYANGFYVVVRRFSSKEERRRIVASVVEPSIFGDSPMLGFENHLNVFHDNRGGLPEMLARGLVVFLNSTSVDEYFRQFNGHTQVNVTDLKSIKYPSREILFELGQWSIQFEILTQEQIDGKVGAWIK